MGLTPGENNEQTSSENRNNENERTTESTSNRRLKNHNSNQKKHVVQIDSEEKGFLGKTKEIEGVLTLKTERLTHKVSFDSFREILGEYVMKNFTGARHLMPLIEEMENPLPGFADANKPRVKRKRDDTSTSSGKKLKVEGETPSGSKEITDDDDEHTYYDPDDYVEKMMLETKIKAYVAQEEQLRNNINKLYAVVWGQCTSSLQAVLKGNDEYEVKHKKRDVLWLFGQIKIVTAGIDNKSNKYMNLQTALLQLLTMRQGDTEANDKFLTRFKSNIQTVELAGGEQYLAPLKWIGEFHTKNEFASEKERFMAMLFLGRCDLQRYSGVLERLQQQMNLGLDQYPVTVALAFDLLVRESGIINQSRSNH